MMPGVMNHSKMMKMLLSISSPGGGAAPASAAEPSILFKNVKKINKNVPWWVAAIGTCKRCKTVGKCFALSAVAVFTAE